jgi:hypothetical protein
LLASKVEDLIMHAAKKSMKIKKKKYRNKASNVCNKKWLDKECLLQRHSVRRLANQKHRDPLNTEIRDKYHATLKIYKNTLKRKKELFHEKKLEELERVSENDPNSFWKLLKNMSDAFGDPSMSKPDVSANSWLTHFQSLHAKHTLETEQNNILQKLTKLEEKTPNNYLYEPISEAEVFSAAKTLKNNKSAYSVRIKNEMLKHSVKILLKLYHKLFNLVLKQGISQINGVKVSLRQFLSQEIKLTPITTEEFA